MDPLNDDVIGVILDLVPSASLVSVWLTCKDLHALAAPDMTKVRGQKIRVAAIAEGSLDLYQWWNGLLPPLRVCMGVSDHGDHEDHEDGSEDEDGNENDDHKCVEGRTRDLIRKMTKKAGEIGVDGGVNTAMRCCNLIQELAFISGVDIHIGYLRDVFLEGVAKTNNIGYYKMVNAKLRLREDDQSGLIAQTLRYGAFDLFNALSLKPEDSEEYYRVGLMGGPVVLDFMMKHEFFNEDVVGILKAARGVAIRNEKYPISEWLEVIFHYDPKLWSFPRLNNNSRLQEMLLAFLARDAEYVRKNLPCIWDYYVPEMKPYILQWGLDKCLIDEDGDILPLGYLCKAVRVFDMPLSKKQTKTILSHYGEKRCFPIREFLYADLLTALPPKLSKELKEKLLKLLGSGVNEDEICKILPPPKDTSILARGKGRTKSGSPDPSEHNDILDEDLTDGDDNDDDDNDDNDDSDDDSDDSDDGEN